MGAWWGGHLQYLQVLKLGVIQFSGTIGGGFRGELRIPIRYPPWQRLGRRSSRMHNAKWLSQTANSPTQWCSWILNAKIFPIRPATTYSFGGSAVTVWNGWEVWPVQKMSGIIPPAWSTGSEGSYDKDIKLKLTTNSILIESLCFEMSYKRFLVSLKYIIHIITVFITRTYIFRPIRIDLS